ncbi:MAG: nickel pincer cofactor biosynthesis protein LarC [Spirochaetales bacterium]
MRFLYYDCFAGISGDMHLGALVDLGITVEYLREELSKLPLKDDYELVAYKDSRRGVSGTRVEVRIGDAVHAHPHFHSHSHSHHDHRSFKEIRALIQQSTLAQSVQTRALSMFQILAEAEGKIHGKSPEEVTFHEVGAIDSIVDIVGSAIGLEALQVDKILCGPLELGGGMVQCAHGTFPVPAPATMEILRGVPVRMGGVPHEATTPTGAAILKGMVHRFVPSVNLQIEKIGYGIGSRDGDVPNVLRICLGEGYLEQDRQDFEGEGLESETLYVLETSVDDMSPELYESAMEELFEAGALDVYFTPVVMKKSRPAVVTTVLCREDSLPTVRKALFLHTTTLGIRETAVRRYRLDRREVLRDTPWGKVRVKQAFYQGGLLREKPEMEDLKALSRKSCLPVETLQRMVQSTRSGSPIKDD